MSASKQAERPELTKDVVTGYRWSAIEKWMPTEQFSKFEDWMRGQTVAIAKDGESIVYPHDLENFLCGMAERKMPDAREFVTKIRFGLKANGIFHLLAYRREVLLAAARSFEENFGPGHWVIQKLERLADEP